MIFEITDANSLPFVVKATLILLSSIVDSATKTGMKLMIIGFFVIIIGLAIIAGLFISATTPWYSRDADKDGIYDEDEKNPDDNNEGVSDDEEQKLKTDPNNPDTDGDTLLDFMERYHYFTNPNIEDKIEDRFKKFGF